MNRRRLLGWALVLMLALVAAPSPAVAHGESEIRSQNFLSELISVNPNNPGIDVSIHNDTEELMLLNGTDQDVIILGYSNEPYLRVGPAGVYANRLSPALYLNRTRDGGAPIPLFADEKAEPEWERIGSSPEVRWHDHRAHWMVEIDPPQVRNAPDERHVVIDRWTVQYVAGGETAEIAGRLLWIPAPSATPWYVLVLGIFLLTLVAVWCRTSAIPMAIVALVVVDIVHRVGLLLTIPTSGTAWATEAFELAAPSAMAWAAGLAAARVVRKGNQEALWLVAFSAGLIAVVSGLGRLSVFQYSQVAFEWGEVAARLLAATSLGAATALVVVVVIRLVRSAREAAASTADEVPEAGTDRVG